MTEKRKPHYDLEHIKQLLRHGRYIPKETAITGAHSMGFSETQIVEVLLDLENKDFYKSMTSYSSNRIWQDVYKKRVKSENVYTKFKVTQDGQGDVVILSFKRDENNPN